MSHKSSKSIVLKDSPWQLSALTNINRFVIFAPNELLGLPIRVFSTIAGKYGNSSGFVVLLDRSASTEMSLCKLRSAVFIPYPIELFKEEPLHAELFLCSYFHTNNPYLSASIRLKHGFTKLTPNPAIALIGSKNNMQTMLNRANVSNISNNLLLLPLDIKTKHIMDYVSREMHLFADIAITQFELGYNLGEFMTSRSSTQYKKEDKHVLVCVTLQTRSVLNATCDTSFVIDLPGGRRNLGETTACAATRVLLEQTGIRRSISDHNNDFYITSDKVNRIYVEEVETVTTTRTVQPTMSLPPIVSPQRGNRKVFANSTIRNNDNQMNRYGGIDISKSLVLHTDNDNESVVKLIPTYVGHMSQSGVNNDSNSSSRAYKEASMYRSDKVVFGNWT